MTPTTETQATALAAGWGYAQGLLGNTPSASEIHAALLALAIPNPGPADFDALLEGLAEGQADRMADQ